MSRAGPPGHAPIPIGEITAPPFARVPNPAVLFAGRAGRLRTLAPKHALGPYLRFLADLADAQHRLQEALPAPDLPGANARERAGEFVVPPLDRGGFTIDPVFEATLARLLALMSEQAMPPQAAAALAAVKDMPDCGCVVQAVLTDRVPAEKLAEHVFVAAALQVHFARLATRLNASTLVPVGEGACPACGAPPVTTLVVGWSGADGARFCTCSLCATLWNYVRIKCCLCGSTEGISYREVEGGPDTVKAEACERCHRYVKILHQHRDPALEPVADDVASLGLDLLMRETPYRRGAVNPFLLGY